LQEVAGKPRLAGVDNDKMTGQLLQKFRAQLQLLHLDLERQRGG